MCLICCRVMDWKKFAYEQQQKADAADKQRRQQQKLSTPKEMQFSARIGGTLGRHGSCACLLCCCYRLCGVHQLFKYIRSDQAVTLVYAVFVTACSLQESAASFGCCHAHHATLPSCSIPPRLL